MVRKNLVISIYLFLTVLLVSTSGCLKLPNEIIAPQWDVNINAPIINRSYTLNDIIKKQNNITTDYSSNPQGIYIIYSDTTKQGVSLVDFAKTTGDYSSTNNTIPPVSGTTYLYVPFQSDSVRIDSAQFQSGTIELVVTNNTNNPVSFDVTVPAIHYQNNPLQISFSVNSNQSVDESVFLSNYEYVTPDTQSSSNKNDLLLEINTSTGGVTNLISTINFSVYVSNVAFSSVTGTFPSVTLGKQTSVLDFSLGDATDFQGKTFLGTAKLYLNTLYEPLYQNNFTLNLDSLTVMGKRNNGQTFFLTDSTGSKYFNIKISNGNNTIEFSNLNSNMADFVSFLPDQVYFNAKYILNGHEQTGTVSLLDSVKFEGNFSTESFFALKKSSITDTTSIQISENDRSQIRDARNMNVNIQIDNGIPLTTWLQVTLTDINHKPLFTLVNNTTNIDSFYFLGADVNQNGEVSNSIISENSVVLDSSQINLFSRAYYAIFTVSVRTKDAYQNPPPIVAIRPSALLKIKAYGEVKYNINPSDK